VALFLLEMDFFDPFLIEGSSISFSINVWKLKWLSYCFCSCKSF
jgi:hypothetical protein